jgi:hypothetical protein
MGVTRTWAEVVGEGAAVGAGWGEVVGAGEVVGRGVGEVMAAGEVAGAGGGAGAREDGEGRRGAAAVEASPRGVVGGSGWWREAGVLDRLRLRHAAVVARARVRAAEPVVVGALIVVGAGPHADSGLWARVERCEGAPDGTFQVVLALLG